LGGQLGGLIEAARPFPARMQRYRHHAVGVGQQLGAVVAHQGA
jgi:hypothetical protein|tara:strand:- start:308 stop:436 length:129 start_codon:yes stop_codon:yes gene_type:complete